MTAADISYTTRAPARQTPARRALVGDIGGTNARFAIVDLSGSARIQLRHARTLCCADYDDLPAALDSYLAALTVPPPSMLVLAVAGPVDGGDVEMTNLSWRIGEAGLRARGFPAVQLVNDYRALAASAGMLKDQDLVDLGSVKSATRDGTIAIIGAGTGLGVSALVREAGKSVAVTGEGGHIGFAPEGAREIEVLNILARRHGRVSAERIVSGPGLVQLYSALCTIAGSAPQFGDPPGIVEQAVRRRGLARDAVEMLCGIFGAVAGDAALFYGARGGVLISGGLSLALASFLKQGLFRQRFEGKGRLAPLVRSIPTRLIVRPDAALLGCAALARDLSMAN